MVKRLFSYIPSLVANGTTMWGIYDPAAPFYGWDYFTLMLTAFAFSAIVWFILETLENVLCNPPKILGIKSLMIIVLIWVGNIWGYAAARWYLDYTGRPHAAIPVFIIWLVFFVSPSLLYKIIGEKREEA